jgi:hypothetical protein
MITWRRELIRKKTKDVVLGHNRGSLARLIAMALGALVLFIFHRDAQEIRDVSKPDATPRGLRVFTAGHSFHVWVAPILAELTKEAGISGHQMVGTHSIGGSRVLQHWEAALPKAAVAADKLDVLTLSPIWLPDDGLEKFGKLASEHNVRVTVQEFWLPNDAFEPIYPLQTAREVDHNATNLEQLRKHNIEYCKGLEELVCNLNKQFGKDTMVVAPVGDASITLREKIVAGEAPGIKTQAELFLDSWGHAQPPLKALAAYCHFAVIYHVSPIGLPIPSILKEAKIAAGDLEKLNLLLQALAWDAVIHNSCSGVKAEPHPIPAHS